MLALVCVSKFRQWRCKSPAKASTRTFASNRIIIGICVKRVRCMKGLNCGAETGASLILGRGLVNVE
jgi:hypothetical protein